MDGINWITAVRNQGQCGSCYCFGPIAIMESMYKIEHNLPYADPDFSEQHLLSCEPLGNCEEGGYAMDVLAYIKQNGTTSENCFPYSAQDIPCNPCPDFQQGRDKIKIRGWQYVTQSRENNDFKGYR